MASDYLLEVDGIKGESQDAQHPGTIEVQSFTWEAENPDDERGFSGSSRKRTAGQVVFKGLALTTLVNKASPDLMLKCWTGVQIKKATLYVRKQGDKQQDYYTVIMDNVIVKNYSSGGSDGSMLPVEHFVLTFAKIKFEYKPQKADGSLEAAITVGYDLDLRKKV